MKESLFKLHGKVQHYAWGGFDYIPSLTGLPQLPGKPSAEYWMGAHPSASSSLELPGGEKQLLALIRESPVEYIGKNVFEKFGELPFLFKILDVREMLSIQVHPSRTEAAKGFDAEQAAGVPLDAPNRNYKDRNHKPEVMVALSEFWLLHGFKQPALLKKLLAEIPEFNYLLPVFGEGNYLDLYQSVMELSQEESDQILLPLVQRELSLPQTKQQPGYWVKKLFPAGTATKNIDKGVFSIYFFNIVKVAPGEAVFQGAGIPHAYLEGQNAELMANSDNVLRGGLTPKHVDVPELLKHTSFEGITPNILKGISIDANETNFPCPVDDFAISEVKLASGESYTHRSVSPEIYIVIEGNIDAGNGQSFKRGESFYVLPASEIRLTTGVNSILYKAFLPGQSW